MGKNAAHKQQQRARHGGADEAGAQDVGDGTVDASFHSPAWCATLNQSSIGLMFLFASGPT